MKDGKKVVATIEARMTSTRLPGKVLLPLGDKPVLARLIERIKRSHTIDTIVIATTINASDDGIVALAKSMDINVWRGSEENVLERVLDAAQSVQADIIVELTGDNPLVDWRHIDYLVGIVASDIYDYASNSTKETFPRGFDVKVFPARVLAEVNRLTQDPVDQENVSIYIYNHPEQYKLYNWSAEGKMARKELRMTLDTKEDYSLIRTLFERLLPQDPDFSAEDVVDMFNQEPELAFINAEIKQKNPYGGYLER